MPNTSTEERLERLENNVFKKGKKLSLPEQEANYLKRWFIFTVKGTVVLSSVVLLSTWLFTFARTRDIAFTTKEVKDRTREFVFPAFVKSLVKSHKNIETNGNGNTESKA